jgi:predicted RNA-binding Zn ribbon-like protein
VVFANDTDAALAAAVELANSALEPDTLTTPADLTRFFARHGYTGRHDGDAAELGEVRGIRETLRALLLSNVDEAVDRINTLLRTYAAVPRLVRHDPVGWHIHASDDEAPLAHRMLVETSMAMIDVIRAGDLSRISMCADETCAGIVLDLSRNRSRRYCSTTCGNRNAVAAYRARRADDKALGGTDGSVPPRA